MANIGRLGLFESIVAMPVSTMAPGTETQKYLIEGNSLISTLFVESLDPGATLKINWWDSGAGTDFGERFDLTSHPLIIGPVTAPFSDRQVISRIHNKPNLEAVVTGGNATFGVYFTVVSSFASDADASLVGQGQDVSLGGDRGQANAVYDPIAGKWYFAQGTHGVQSVNIEGGMITALPVAIENVATGSVPSLPYGSAGDLFAFTAPSTILVPEVVGSGDGAGEFRLYVNGALWGVQRSSWAKRQVSFAPGAIKLNAGDVLRLNVTNIATDGDLASYEGMAYYGT